MFVHYICISICLLKFQLFSVLIIIFQNDAVNMFSYYLYVLVSTSLNIVSPV